jgi:hypothetical protein
MERGIMMFRDRLVRAILPPLIHYLLGHISGIVTSRPRALVISSRGAWSTGAADERPPGERSTDLAIRRAIVGRCDRVGFSEVTTDFLE